jgi:hypothetical protein
MKYFALILFFLLSSIILHGQITDTIISKKKAIEIATKKGCYKNKKGWGTSVSFDINRKYWEINARKELPCHCSGDRSFKGRAKGRYMLIDATTGKIIEIKKSLFPKRYLKY